MERKIQVTLMKRPATERLRVILKGIGLKKTGSTKVLSDSPSIRGMVDKVAHLVCIKDA